MSCLLVAGMLFFVIIQDPASGVSAKGFTAIAPVRLADSRGGATVDGQGNTPGTIAPEATLTIRIAGRSTIALGARAATLTFTIVSPTDSGYLTVWPCGATKPTASIANFVANQTVAITTVVGLSATGDVCTSPSARSHLLVDAVGVDPIGSTYVPITPLRVLDTRQQATFDNTLAPVGLIPAGQLVVVPLLGREAILGSASNVVASVTAVGATGGGYLTVWNCAAVEPGTSTLNVANGNPVANTTVVSTAGGMCLRPSVSMFLLVDVMGYEPAVSDQFRAGLRILDTRSPIFQGRPMGGGTSRSVPGLGGETVSLNLTVTEPRTAGFITVWPSCSEPRPETSSINFAAGQTVANFVVSKAASNSFCLYTSADTQVVVDLLGGRLSEPKTIRVQPIADAMLEDGVNSGTNYGSNSILGVDRAPERESILRFPVGIDVQSAILRLHVSAPTISNPTPQTINGPTVSVVADGSPWNENSITFANRPTTVGAATAQFSALGTNSWYEADLTSALRPASGVPGFVNVVLRAASSDGTSFDSKESAFPPELVILSAQSPGQTKTIAAVGDIACPPGATATTIECHHFALSNRILADPTIDAFLGLGDLQYPSGSFSDYLGSYDPSFGRFLTKTLPVPGNHEYDTPNASGYFGYFNDRLVGPVAQDPAKGYYASTIGAWNVLALNSNCTVASCAVGGPQELWLQQQLIDSRTRGHQCTLAMWHHPRFGSGTQHGSNVGVDPLWRDLANAGADVVLAGHEHLYERFDPLDQNGAVDVNGVRSFVVGTGGKSFYTFSSPVVGSAARVGQRYGYLRIHLMQRSYQWAFITELGEILDAGRAECVA
jgi:acid phosphatase type 7